MFRTHRNDSRRLHPSGVSARSERLVGTQGARDPWVSNPIGVARGSLGADLCRASARASVAKCTYSILRTALVLGKAGSQGQGFAPDLSESSVPSSLPPRLRSASRALVRPLPPPEAGPENARERQRHLWLLFGSCQGFEHSLVWMGPPLRSLTGEWNTDAGG